MGQMPIPPEIRKNAELQFSEIFGRLHACQTLEEEAQRVDDSRVLYGWNMLTQEVLLRAAEASLKLLYLVHFKKQSKRGHDLSKLWAQLPESVQREVEAERKTFPGGDRGVSFAEYDMGTFQDVRYSHERLFGGKSIRFEVGRLCLDCIAIVGVVEKWLGDISVWPWAGFMDPELSGYKVIPVQEGKYDVLVENPIEPMDWAGAVIEQQQGKYIWTLYCGFVDRNGGKRSYQIPSLTYQWPIGELMHDSVIECVEQIHQAFQQPSYPLQKAIEEAESE